MKKTVFTFVLFAWCALSFQAQTADEIIANYFETIGGVDALNKLEGIKMSANVNSGGMNIPLDIFMFKDGKQYVDIELQGKRLVQVAFDGETAWGVNFMSMKPEKQTAEDVENMKRSIGDFPDPLLNYADRGYTCELMGKETVEGVMCYKIKLTKQPLLVDGEEVVNEYFYYLDVDNNVPLMVENEMKSGPMKGKMAQEVFSDYQEVDGIYFPFTTENRIKGTDQSQTIVYEKIELNPTLDPAVFVMPAEPKDAVGK